jgi:hypothetical protein
MVTMRNTKTKTRCDCDRDRDGSNTSDQDFVSCHSYHVWDVDVTMINFVVAIIPPMMGHHKDNTISKTSRDREHDDSNTSGQDSYHLRAVDVTMPKYVAATMTPMMGDHKDNNNQYKP